MPFTRYNMIKINLSHHAMRENTGQYGYMPHSTILLQSYSFSCRAMRETTGRSELMPVLKSLLQGAYYQLQLTAPA